jgi:uncharacterized cupin superfamily protein
VVEAAGDTRVREGDQVAFRIRADACHLFDASGKSLTRSLTGNAAGRHQAV